MAPTLKTLTPREQEALTLLARGMASNQIASSMCITLGSVQNILQGVRNKLAVETSIQAVVWAWSQGLVRSDEALVEQ